MSTQTTLINITVQGGGRSELRLMYSLSASVLIALSVLVLWVLCCFGNVLVIVAIAVDRRLQGVQHWFLASLAAADFLLGVLVLPFSLVKQLFGDWLFGERWCELWLVIDVMLCTASILNLCLISLDRYWCVSKPFTYRQNRTQRRAACMIGLVWLLAAVVCVPPLLGWRQVQRSETTCELTDDLGYVLYSTIGSFYIPTTIMSVVYVKIFIVTREHARRTKARHHSNKKDGHVEGGEGGTIPRCYDLKTKDAYELKSHVALHHTPSPVECDNESLSSMKDLENGQTETMTAKLGDRSTTLDNHSRQKRKFVKQRERRATIILGLIMGAYIFCWFPFFTTYVIDILCRRAICTTSIFLPTVASSTQVTTQAVQDNQTCACVPVLLFDIFFWLGYCNSALNPVIYTVFNHDFRLAFQQLLSCAKYRPRN